MNGLVRGGLLTKRPLLLAEDGEVFLCVCDNDIRVYSARTGLLLSTLRGHTAEVTALAQHPLNSRQVRALDPQQHSQHQVFVTSSPCLPVGLRYSSDTNSASCLLYLIPHAPLVCRCSARPWMPPSPAGTWPRGGCCSAWL